MAGIAHALLLSSDKVQWVLCLLMPVHVHSRPIKRVAPPLGATQLRQYALSSEVYWGLHSQEHHSVGQGRLSVCLSWLAAFSKVSLVTCTVQLQYM